MGYLRGYGRYTDLWTEISLQTRNIVVSFVCFGFEPVSTALTIVHFDGTPILSLHSRQYIYTLTHQRHKSSSVSSSVASHRVSYFV